MGDSGTEAGRATHPAANRPVAGYGLGTAVAVTVPAESL